MEDEVLESDSTEEDKQVDATETEVEDKAYKGRFTQFQAKTADEYIKKLEDGYLHSSNEGQRLNAVLTEKEQENDVIRKVINADPALKKAFSEKLYDGDYDEGELTPAKIAGLMREVMKEEVPKIISANPAIQGIENTTREKDRTVFLKFQEEHPDLVTDPGLAKDFEEAFGIVAQLDAKKNGGVYNFERSIQKAWKMVSDDNDRKDDLEKNNAASGMSSTTKKSGSGRQLSDLEKTIAKQMGLSDEAYLEGKELSKKAKEQ